MKPAQFQKNREGSKNRPYCKPSLKHIWTRGSSLLQSCVPGGLHSHCNHAKTTKNCEFRLFIPSAVLRVHSTVLVFTKVESDDPLACNTVTFLSPYVFILMLVLWDLKHVTRMFTVLQDNRVVTVLQTCDTLLQCCIPVTVTLLSSQV